MPFLDGVRRAVCEGGYDVVFGGGDDWVAALATYRDEIPARIAHPEAATVAAALDKVELARRGVRLGFSVPRTELATEPVLAGWEGPVIVKCRAHWHPGQQHRHRIEAVYFEDAATARDQVRLVRAAGLDPILQEVVDGQLGALIGLFHDGQLLGRVQQETYRLWPTPCGVSSRAQTVPVDEGLAAHAAALLADLGWTGLVELQFLTDARGERHLIDLNGRFYGSMALANAAGPNLPDAWARQVLGEQLPPLQDGRPGVRFTWAAADLRRALAERRSGLLADVGSSLRWAWGAERSVWDRHDVGPTLDLVASRFRRTASAPAG